LCPVLAGQPTCVAGALRKGRGAFVKVQYIALVQLGCYALAQGLGELNGLLQGQLEGALAEGVATELVE